MQFILVEKGDRRRYNLLFCSEDLDRVYTKVPVEFLDDSFTYVLVPVGYMSLNTSFFNQAAVNTIIQERTPLFIAKDNWRKYITANRSEASHFLYHTNEYFRRTRHIFSLTSDKSVLADFRTFEFGSSADKRVLAQRWQAQELLNATKEGTLDCIGKTTFGRSVMHYLMQDIKTIADNYDNSDESVIITDKLPSNDWQV